MELPMKRGTVYSLLGREFFPALEAFSSALSFWIFKWLALTFL